MLAIIFHLYDCYNKKKTISAGCCSIKHEFDGDWKGNATLLKTCDPHSRRLVVDSDSPQEVDANKEIIFTYGVNFEVTFNYFSS